MKIVLMRNCLLPEDAYHELLDPIAHVTCIPVLSFSYININLLQENINQPSLYSGIILTSKRAIEALKLCVVDSKNLPNEWLHKPCYVVGNTTAIAAQSMGFQITGKESGNAEALAKFIISDKANLKRNSPLLFVCGQSRREVLPKYLQEHEQPCEILEVYCSGADPLVEHKIKSYCEQHSAPQYLVYFSPLGYKFSFFVWKDFLCDSNSPVKVVTIGQTTAKAFENEDVEVMIANQPTAASVHDAIETDIKSNCGALENL